MPGFWAGLGQSKPITSAVSGYQNTLMEQLRRQLAEQQLEQAKLYNEVYPELLNNQVEIGDLNIKKLGQAISLQEALTPYQLKQEEYKTSLLGTDAEYAPLLKQVDLETGQTNLDQIRQKFPYELGLLENKLLQSDLYTENYPDILNLEIEGARLGNRGKELSNEAQTWENKLFKDIYGDMVRQKQLEVAMGEKSLEQAMQELKQNELKLQQQQAYLERYKELLDNQVKAGKLTNAEKEMKLLEAQKAIDDAVNQDFIERLMQNPDLIRTAINQGVLTPEVVEKLNRAYQDQFGYDFNIFRFPEGEGGFNVLDYVDDSTLYKDWATKHAVVNEFTGDVIGVKEGSPSFLEYVNQIRQGSTSQATEETPAIEITTPEEAKQPTSVEKLPKKQQEIAKNIVEWIPEEEFTKENVLQFLTADEGLNLSIEEATQIINALFPEKPVAGTDNVYKRQLNFSNLFGVPNTQWNELWQKVFQDDYITFDIPFLPNNINFTLW